VPTRDLSETIDLEAWSDLDLLASIEDGRLTVKPNLSRTPPGYG
jgi:hypothetical protein